MTRENIKENTKENIKENAKENAKENIKENTKENYIEETGQKRLYFLDILRVAATCAVVLMHTLTGTVDAVDISQYPVERLVYLVTMDLITWCVPVFLLISGCLFLNPARQISFVQMLKKYCRRIVLALFLFGVPYAMLELILVEKKFRIAMIGQGFLMVLQGKSWSHMWYLYLILGLYLVTPGLKWMLARVPVFCIYGFLAVLLLGSSLFPFGNKLFGVKLPVLPDEGIYLFYYLCGYLFVSGRQLLFAPRQKERWTSAVMSGGILLLCLGMLMSRIYGFSLQMAYNYPLTVIVSLLIFGAGKSSEIKLGRKAASLWLDTGKISFCVYLIHPVFVNILYKLLHISLLDFPIGISLPLFSAIILLLSVMAAGTLYQIPFLRKYVL